MDSTLVEIVKLYERFHDTKAGHTDDTVLNFIAFLIAETHGKKGDSGAIGKSEWSHLNRKTLLEMCTAYLGKMGRYVDNYGRKNMPLTPISSLDEFTYLIPLLEEVHLSKSELINLNGHPVTTGSEIIKRLIKKKYVTTFKDSNDGRKSLVKITDAGKIALFASAETAQKMSYIALGILSNEELVKLLSMFTKLNDFHDQVFKTEKELNLDRILANHTEKIQLP